MDEEFRERAPELAHLFEELVKTVPATEQEPLSEFYEQMLVLTTWYTGIAGYAALSPVEYLKVVSDLAGKYGSGIGLPDQALFTLARDSVDHLKNGYVPPQDLQKLKEMAPRNLMDILSHINKGGGEGSISSMFESDHANLFLAWMYTISVRKTVASLVNEKGFSTLLPVQHRILTACLADEASFFVWDPKKSKLAP